MEAIGVFFLTIVIATGNPWAIGFMFAALMYIGFHVSGSHYNPAVSVAAFINNDIKRDECLKYIAAQIVGAFFGTYVAMMYFGGGVHMFGVSSELGIGIQVMMEALLTGLFCWAFLTATMTAALRSAGVYGLVCGFTLVAIGSIGGLFNPAVAMGSMLMSMAQGAGCMCHESMLVYLIAPFAGAILAAYAYPYFHKK
jgi:aquaporin Z